MLSADLNYHLPEAAIAQSPAEPRDSARLLVDRGPGSAPAHQTVADLADLLDPGDVLVVNDTRVLPARLRMAKATGGAVEVLLLERISPGVWEALVRPGRRVPPGTHLTPAAPGPGVPAFTVTVEEVLGDDGRRRVTMEGDAGDDLDVVTTAGEVPLPPYITRPLTDPNRYQTVFAAEARSVAAPTAGLHLTLDLLGRCRERGVTVAKVDLAVGLGTFRPITTEMVEDHPMHVEHYRIPPATRELLAPRLGGNGTGRSVVAVGTTTVRALESWAASGHLEGATDLFIRTGHRFALVDRLLTNFHVPRSSLLAMVEAFVGPRWRDLYTSALDEGYRFLSFGDAMLLDHAPEAPIP